LLLSGKSKGGVLRKLKSSKSKESKDFKKLFFISKTTKDEDEEEKNHYDVKYILILLGRPESLPRGEERRNNGVKRDYLESGIK
jgi:hypothetical protein